jgi:uncharacterized protein (UPF0332 family)
LRYKVLNIFNLVEGAQLLATRRAILERFAAQSKGMLRDSQILVILLGSCAYYAMSYGTEAALLIKGLEYSSHAAVVSRFGERFIESNLLPRRLGKALSKTFRLRMVSNYDVSIPESHVKTLQEMIGMPNILVHQCRS